MSIKFQKGAVPKEGETFSNMPSQAPSLERVRAAMDQAIREIQQGHCVQFREPVKIVPLRVFEELADGGIICEHCGREMPTEFHDGGRVRCSDCKAES